MITQKQKIEDDRLIDMLRDNAGAYYPDFKHMDRVPHRVAKRLLLLGKFFSHGRMLEYSAKSVGCGVCEVWAEVVE